MWALIELNLCQLTDSKVELNKKNNLNNRTSNNIARPHQRRQRGEREAFSDML